ncbi:MAG: RAMP superfamily CRISPR-associated protein [Desulfococcaceae bacterium]|jgi:CRISPR/Cas system CSM-associated protein Csm3 (group 7 of RAMP superfamily)|nr:RAMP superfamily CRISPR-associated protein [Desulfococcaceae bacterium]
MKKNEECEKKIRLLKGDNFCNRYRIEGILTTRSPFHLGNGDTVRRRGLNKDGKEGIQTRGTAGSGSKEQAAKKQEPVDVSAITVDYRGQPVIPGSSLKGALRNYLLDICLASRQEGLAADLNYDELIRTKEKLKKQKGQIEFARDEISVLERLFGTPFAEGKTEVWDGECISPPPELPPAIRNPEKPPFWDSERMTFVDQSVAIDPETGTAVDKKLYHYEVVPPGISFRINISGQNLVRAETGMLLFGLYAFNSEIWPLTLGAMSGRGFGHFDFHLENVYHLPKSDVGKWIRKALENDHAGYMSLKCLPQKEQDDYIKEFKKMFLKCTGDES